MGDRSELRRRVLVRGLRECDRGAWISGLQRSEALHRAWMPIPPADLSWDARFDRALAQYGSGTCFKGLAFDAEDRLAAWVNLNDIVRGASFTANAGWSVHADFAGMGIATEAVGALLDLAFAPEPEGLGLHRVACGIMPENVRSLRVAEKNGFRREGYAVKLVQIAGEWRDHVLFAKLAEEGGG